MLNGVYSPACELLLRRSSRDLRQPVMYFQGPCVALLCSEYNKKLSVRWTKKVRERVWHMQEMCGREEMLFFSFSAELACCLWEGGRLEGCLEFAFLLGFWVLTMAKYKPSADSGYLLDAAFYPRLSQVINLARWLHAESPGRVWLMVGGDNIQYTFFTFFSSEAPGTWNQRLIQIGLCR